MFKFTEEQICGIFTPTHFVAIFVYFALLAGALYMLRNITDAGIHTLTLIIAVTVTVLEIIKIAVRVYRGQPGDDYIPLYYSSLFIYAAWLSLFKNKVLQRIGKCFLAYGCVIGGSLFVLYPSTSLPKFPIWHPAALHSLFYHWLMLTLGLTVLIKQYKPKIKDFFSYFALTGTACAVAAVLNAVLHTNLMYLDNPFGLSFLVAMHDASQLFYSMFAFTVQSVVLFFVAYFVHTSVLRLIVKKREAADPSGRGD